MAERAIKPRRSISSAARPAEHKQPSSRAPRTSSRRPLNPPLTEAQALFDAFELEVLDEEKHQQPGFVARMMIKINAEARFNRRQKRDLLHKLDAAKEVYHRIATDPAVQKWDEFYRDIDSRRTGIKARERARIQNEMWRSKAVLGQSSYRSLTQKLKRIPAIETRRGSMSSGNGETLNPAISPVTSAPTSAAGSSSSSSIGSASSVSSSVEDAMAANLLKSHTCRASWVPKWTRLHRHRSFLSDYDG